MRHARLSISEADESDRADSRASGDLTNNPLWKNTRCISQLIYGAGSSQAELITRQYLLLRVGGIWLNKALLYSYGTGESPVIHPLPSIWQGLLIRRGIPVAKIRCSLMWAGYVVMIWAYGVLSGMRTILASLLRIVRPLPPTPNRFAYFHSLTAASLPQPGRDGRSHDIVTWYLRWDGRPKMLDAVCHGVRDAEPSLVGGVHVEYVEGASLRSPTHQACHALRSGYSKRFVAQSTMLCVVIGGTHCS